MLLFVKVRPKRIFHVDILTGSVTLLAEKKLIIRTYNEHEITKQNISHIRAIITSIRYFYPATTDIPQKCSISVWGIHVNLEGGRNVDAIRSFNWEALQQSLLELDPVPTLVLESTELGGVRWILEAVMRDLILGPALTAQKLEIHLGSSLSSSGMDCCVVVPLTAAFYAIGGSNVLLNPMQRFEHILRDPASSDKIPGFRYKRKALPEPQDPDEYLRNILAQQTALEDKSEVSTQA